MSDPALVTAAIVRVLGLRDDSKDRTLPERLQWCLRDKEMLLFLDNFEQVKVAASLLVRLLSGCPRIKILVASRAALHVRGEQELEILPLGVPNLGERDPAVLIEYPAVALFVGRTQATDPAFSLTEDNARAVTEICRKLDGLSLAVELTAARSKLLPPNILPKRLDRGLGLISGGG